MKNMLLGKRVYLDANIFIYALEGAAPYKKTMTSLFEHLSAGYYTAVTSEISLKEILPKSVGLGRSDFAARYLDMLTGSEHLSLVAIDPYIEADAAQLRVDYRLEAADAIHLATARIMGCDIMLSNDQGLRQASKSMVFLSPLELQN